MSQADPLLHIGLGLHPSTGGTTAVVADFTRAVPGKVVALCDRQHLQREGCALADALTLNVASGLRGRLYDWIPASESVRLRNFSHNVSVAVCHVLYRHHVHLVRRVAKQRRIPYWVVPHGCLDPYAFSYRRWQKELWMALIGKRFLTEASCVLCATQAEKRKMARRYTGVNIRVVNWPISSLDLAGANEARAQVAAELGLRDDARVLLYVGRLHSMKRPLETIRAMAAAGEKNVHLVMIGPPETCSIEECRQVAQECGARNIHVLGPVYGSAKLKYLLAADGFISLSQRENFGLAAGEALMAGVPLILSPGNDLGGEFDDGSFSWRLCTDEIGEAAIAIREFARLDRNELRRRGELGRDWAQSRLSFQRFQSRVCSLWKETLNHHSSAG